MAARPTTRRTIPPSRSTSGAPVTPAVRDFSAPASGPSIVWDVRSIYDFLFSLNDEAAYAQRVLQLGASGYLSKERAAAELIQAMERIAEGKRYITVSQAERIAEVALGEADRAPHETLSMQEHRVMVYLAQGKRLTEIGELMHLSPKTITTYRARVLEKIGVDSNQALLKYCLSHGVSVG